MRKSVSALVVFLSLLTPLVVGVQTVVAPYVSGGESFPLAGPLNISSPSNVTYNTRNLSLVVTCVYLLGPKYADFCYSLDGTNKISIPLTGTQEPREGTVTYANGTTVVVNSTLFVPFDLTGETALSGLSEGPHTIVVYAEYNANNVIGYDESTVYFTIDTETKTATIPEFPASTVIPLILAAALVAIVYRKHMKKLRKTSFQQ